MLISLLHVLQQACHGCVGSKCDCSGVKGAKVGKMTHSSHKRTMCHIQFGATHKHILHKTL